MNKIVKRTPLSWSAVLHGATYCAPACGRGCTFAEYQAATDGAARLCATLGKGWVPRVWENLGWHYTAISSCLRWRISPSGGIGYHAFLGDPTPVNEAAGGRWAEHGATPAAAMRATWKRAKAAIDDHMAFLDAAPWLRGRSLTGRRG